MKLRLNRDILHLILILLAVILSVSLIFIVLRKLETAEEEKAAAEREADELPGVPGTEDAYADEDGTEEIGAQLYRNGKWYTQNKDLETVLLIGTDKFEEDVPTENMGTENNQRSDFLMLLLLDHGKKTCQALHINRDTMAEIQKLGPGGVPAGTATEQLALAHAYGTGGEDSCENTVTAVSGFLYGIPIDHYVSVTMDAVSELTDLAGGVPVTVMDDFTAVDPSMKKDALVDLSGEQALLYVRARQELAEPTNLRRMERQRQFIEELRKVCAGKMQQDETFLTDAVLTVTPYMVTDCTTEDLDRLGTCAAEYESKGIATIEGEAVKGETYMEFYPDEEALKDQILELFYVPSDT